MGSGSAWTEKEAAHLLRRATFSATAAEVKASVALGREETVKRLIAGKPISGSSAGTIPAIAEVRADGKPLQEDRIADQQLYWLYRMAHTDAPLLEKMTLFWHNHFATSYRKVREVPLMVRQNELFRQHALGSFKELVLAVGRDPAMMIWLDTNSNRKGKPNENYAREVMELFTLGIGHYSEKDIREAARALTGWHVERTSGEVTFQAKQHDSGMKTVFGETGNYDMDDMVELLFRQPSLPEFMARKLLQFFAVDAPDDAWMKRTAADFAAAGTIGDVLERLFLSDAFYEPSVRMALVKTPAEYVAGWMRALPLPLSRSYAGAMLMMGQELYAPPDVAGWRGGTTWLMASWLLARCQFAETAAFRFDGSALLGPDFTPAEHASAPASEWVRLWALRIGVGELGEKTASTLQAYAEDAFVRAGKANLNGMRGLLQLLMASPEAQMK
jgi:uncharacterized protein (DUF1800 family)